MLGFARVLLFAVVAIVAVACASPVEAGGFSFFRRQNVQINNFGNVPQAIVVPRQQFFVPRQQVFFSPPVQSFNFGGNFGGVQSFRSFSSPGCGALIIQ